MSERMLTIAEKRQMKAVIKALTYGMELCEDDEKSLIKRFIVTQSLRINSGTKPEFTTDELRQTIYKRKNLQQICRCSVSTLDPQTRRLRTARVDTFDRSALYYRTAPKRKSQDWSRTVSEFSEFHNNRYSGINGNCTPAGTYRPIRNGYV